MKADWSRKLARPVKVRKGPMLKTLRDVRAFVLALPKDQQQFETWGVVANALLRASNGAGTVEVTLTLEIVLMLEGRWKK